METGAPVAAAPPWPHVQGRASSRAGDQPMPLCAWLVAFCTPMRLSLPPSPQDLEASLFLPLACLGFILYEGVSTCCQGLLSQAQWGASWKGAWPWITFQPVMCKDPLGISFFSGGGEWGSFCTQRVKKHYRLPNHMLTFIHPVQGRTSVVSDIFFCFVFPLTVEPRTDSLKSNQHAAESRRLPLPV